MWDFLAFAAASGAEEVVCTLGVHGSCGISRGQRWQVPAHLVQAEDALGAGDAFIAAFLTAFYGRGGDAPAAAEEASRFAAACCAGYGAFGHPFPIADSRLLPET